MLMSPDGFLFVEDNVAFDSALFGVPSVMNEAKLVSNLVEKFHIGSPVDGGGIYREVRGKL